MSQPVNVILTKDEDENGSKQEWHYFSVIGHKCISLIQSMRYYIPLRLIMLEVSSVFGIKCDSYNSYTSNFENNKGEIELAKETKYRHRTKHLSIK